MDLIIYLPLFSIEEKGIPNFYTQLLGKMVYLMMVQCLSRNGRSNLMKIIIKGILICFMSILSFTPVFAEETNLNTIPDDKIEVE